MRQTFVIEGRFPSLDEFYRMSPHEQERVKHECDERVAWSVKAAHVMPYSVPIRYSVLWIEPNRQRDLDNIAFGKKFVQNGLLKARILANDTHRELVGFSDEFAYDAQNPRIVVTLEEA